MRFNKRLLCNLTLQPSLLKKQYCVIGKAFGRITISQFDFTEKWEVFGRTTVTSVGGLNATLQKALDNTNRHVIGQ